MKRRQQGVALVTVMIIVAMVAATASWLMLQQHVALKRMGNVLYEEQALLLALGAESYVRKLLTNDAQSDRDKPVDYYARVEDKSDNEKWSKQGTLDDDLYFPLPGFENRRNARLTWCVFDLSAYHNANNFRFLALDNQGSQRGGTQRPKSVRQKSEEKQAAKRGVEEKPSDDGRKSRVLTAAEWERKMFDSIYQGNQEQWAALMDWFDQDTDARADGAEESYYLNLEPPHRVFGIGFSWPEEFGLVKGFQSYRSLTSFFTLPSVKPVKININTASREMLSRIFGFMQISIGGEEWAQFLERRTISPFRNLDDFYRQLVTYEDERITKAELSWASRFLDVKSNYFMALIQVKLGTSNFYLQSVFVRDTEDPYSVYVLQRRLGKIDFERERCRVDTPVVEDEEKAEESQEKV